MTALEILKAARAKVAAGWTQGDFARDAMGDGVRASDPSATCFCSLGALLRVAPLDVSPTERARAEDLLDLAVDGRIVRFNDTPGRTQAEVLAAFDKAIALAEGSK